ncbi:hypothetical protein [Cryobacterium algoritolerans]|uniref:hypothetical protein n=1 Tax=Cryobacterium algoritolerans TaxID=1259184 RepID=UPI00157FFF14|nr:hypothetical protein [Cryobacterium algoritolerans]
MGIKKDVGLAFKLLKDVTASRKAQRLLNGRLAMRDLKQDHHFKIAVYFADGGVNLYQIRQWYKPLAELAEKWPVLILSRSGSGALPLIDEAPVPVAYVRKVSDLERVLEEQDIRIVLYVNQNPRNFQMMHYGRRWHVFINHGESDKVYMVTNQIKAYDYAFVAGDAALARLDKVLWDYDFDKRAIKIGRPQADHYSGTLPYTPDERQVVLYAPTWEGDRPAAAYGSIGTHGMALVSALLDTGRHRVIYRPHPRSGVIDTEYAAANRRIITAIAAANSRDASARHIYDASPDLGWQLSVADVAIVDISAMVYDRLAAGKALMVTRPVNPDAQIDSSGYLSDCEWLDAAEAGDIVRVLEDLSQDSEVAQRLAVWVERYFGDTGAGVATERFQAAVQHLMDEWDRFNVMHPAATSVDALEAGPVTPVDAADGR